jgi:hypothetical protein
MQGQLFLSSGAPAQAIASAGYGQVRDAGRRIAFRLCLRLRNMDNEMQTRPAVRAAAPLALK